MADQLACPDATSLERLVQGLVPDQDAPSLEEHVEHCARCTEALSAIQSKDLLIQRLQEGRLVAKELPQGSVVEELIRAVGQIGASDTLDAAGTTPDSSELSLDAILAPPVSAGEIGRLGRFSILKIIGQGGMGAVLAAEDPKLGRTVALKVVQPARAQQPGSRNRFLREARAAAAVSHDNIVPVYEVGEDRGILYLVMPLLQGESLQTRLQREGALPPVEVARLGRQIAEALCAAHARGLIHRDIKPTNIWLEETPAGCRAKILDFGLARLTQDDARMTSDGVILGTPAYIAPEQARGQAVDARADLFSLGCVLYQAATGRLPWQGADSISAMLARFMETPKTPIQVNPLVPPALSDIIMWLLAREPSNRPENAAVLAQALGAPEGGQSTQLSPRLRPPRRRRWFWLLPPALAVLALPLVFPGTWRRWLHRDSHVPIAPEPAPFVSPQSHPHVKLDDLQRERIDPYELRLAGRGDPARAPAELVAILGDSRFNDCAPLTFSHDATELITQSSDDMLRAWDTTTGQERRRSPGSPHIAALSPDGKILALGMRDGNIKILDAATWTETIKLKKVHTGSFFWALAFSQDGQMLAASCNDLLATVWDIKTGANLLKLPLGNLANTVGFRDGGKTLVVACNNCLRLFEVSTGKQKEDFANNPCFEWPSFSPDGSLSIRSVGDDKHQLVDTGTGEVKTVLEGKCERSPRRGVFSFDGKMVAIGGRQGVARVWDVASGKLLYAFDDHISYGSLTCLAFSRDGKLLAAGGDDGRGRIWELATGKQRFPAVAHAGHVSTVSFNPQGTFLASGGADNKVRFWNLTALNSPTAFVSGHTTGTNYVAFSPDGNQLASCGNDGMVWFPRAAIPPNYWHIGGRITQTAWSPDGRTIAAASLEGKKAVLWDANTDHKPLELSHRWPVCGVAFSTDGRLLAVCSSSPEGVYAQDSVQLWNISRPEQDGLLKAEPVADVLPSGCRIAFHPDGKTLVIANIGLIHIYDVQEKKDQKVLAGPEWFGGENISISPDGRWLAISGGRDCKLWLWDLQLQNPVARTILFSSATFGNSFSFDGRHIAVGNGNGTISILRLAPPNDPGEKR